MSGVSEFYSSSWIRRFHLQRVDPVSFGEQKLHVCCLLPNHPGYGLVQAVTFKLREVSGLCERLIFLSPLSFYGCIRKKTDKSSPRL